MQPPGKCSQRARLSARLASACRLIGGLITLSPLPCYRDTLSKYLGNNLSAIRAKRSLSSQWIFIVERYISLFSLSFSFSSSNPRNGLFFPVLWRLLLDTHRILFNIFFFFLLNQMYDSDRQRR